MPLLKPQKYVIIKPAQGHNTPPLAVHFRHAAADMPDDAHYMALLKPMHMAELALYDSEDQAQTMARRLQDGAAKGCRKLFTPKANLDDFNGLVVKQITISVTLSDGPV